MSEAIIIRSGNVTKGYVDSNLELKADKIDGKSLSTNDYDDAAKEAVESLGTASKCNTGTNEGDIPVINSNGKLDASILPQIAITDTFTAETEEQMLGLQAQKGDICIRSDENKTYILQNEPASELQNWLELTFSTDAVQSVNGKTGVVTLNYEDVGAVQANTEIAGGTKCKITYDSKGLVTSGEDLTADDIPDISVTYASTKALTDGLATKAEVKKFTATVGTSWTQGANNEYTQEIAVAGILETDTPTIDLVLSDNVETAKSQIEGWSNVSRITTETGKIKIYCYDSAPDIQIPIQIICIR